MGSPKLYIYDSSSAIDRRQAAGRFSGDADVTTLPCASIADLHTGLAGLVAAGKTFKRCLFQTHGNSGMIFFDHAAIRPTDVRTAFSGKGYDSLFPNPAKIYFDGCDVADGSDGWKFLSAMGQTFLLNHGGITMGYTSLGFGLPGWVPLIGGHTEHLWGDLRFIEFRNGGVESSRFDSDGAAIWDMAKAVKKLDGF